MIDEFDAIRDELANKERIYEPKYGGKDHSGYDTLMKYEVNDYREECFIKGFDVAVKLCRDEIDKLQTQIEFLKQYYNPEDTSVKTMVETFVTLSDEQKQALINLTESLRKMKDAK